MKPSFLANQGGKTASENPKQLRAEGNGLQSNISGAVAASKTLGSVASLRDRTKHRQ